MLDDEAGGPNASAAAAKLGDARPTLVRRPVIDAGADFGLAADGLVLAGRRVWGKIAAVGPYTSVVCRVCEPGYRDAVQLGHVEGRRLQLGPRGLLVGTGEPLCRVEMVEVSQPVAIGDEVYTSDDGVPHAPLLYGRVVRLERSAGQPHWQIWMEPAVGSDEPRSVAVLQMDLNPARVAEDVAGKRQGPSADDALNSFSRLARESCKCRPRRASPAAKLGNAFGWRSRVMAIVILMLSVYVAAVLETAPGGDRGAARRPGSVGAGRRDLAFGHRAAAWISGGCRHWIGQRPHFRRTGRRRHGCVRLGRLCDCRFAGQARFEPPGRATGGGVAGAGGDRAVRGRRLAIDFRDGAAWPTLAVRAVAVANYTAAVALPVLLFIDWRRRPRLQAAAAG